MLISLAAEVIAVKTIVAEGLVIGVVDINQDNITILQVAVMRSEIGCLEIVIFLVQLITRTSLQYLFQDY